MPNSLFCYLGSTRSCIHCVLEHNSLTQTQPSLLSLQKHCMYLAPVTIGYTHSAKCTTPFLSDYTIPCCTTGLFNFCYKKHCSIQNVYNVCMLPFSQWVSFLGTLWPPTYTGCHRGGEFSAVAAAYVSYHHFLLHLFESSWIMHEHIKCTMYSGEIIAAKNTLSARM